MHQCSIGSLVFCCDQFDRGSRWVKRNPVDQVTEDYDITLRWRIILIFILAGTLNVRGMNISTCLIRDMTERERERGEKNPFQHSFFQHVSQILF